MKDKISFPFKKKVYMGDEYIKKVLKENKLMQENQKLKKALNKTQVELGVKIMDLKEENQKLKKELLDLKELMLKTINVFEIALELKEVKNK